MVKLDDYLNPRNLLLPIAITTGIVLSGCGREANSIPTPKPLPAPLPIAVSTQTPTPKAVLPLDYQITRDPNTIPQKEGREVSKTELGYVVQQAVSIGDTYRVMLARGHDCLVSVWKRGPPVDFDGYTDVNCDGSVDFGPTSPGTTKKEARTPEREDYFRQLDKQHVYWLQQLGVLEKVPQKTSLHQRLNPHMYGRKGILKPQYT